MQVEINGTSVTDKIARQQATQTLLQNASTEALQLLAQISEKPNANKKLIDNKKLINSFI